MGSHEDSSSRRGRQAAHTSRVSQGVACAGVLLQEEAATEVMQILDLYARVYTDLLAVPVCKVRPVIFLSTLRHASHALLAALASPGCSCLPMHPGRLNVHASSK